MFSYLRWRKVWRDLWSNKTRSILVILSITLGVFAVGVVIASQTILSREMDASYVITNPSSVSFGINAFDQDLVELVQQIHSVARAEGRYITFAQFQNTADAWEDMRLMAVADYETVEIHKILSESGSWPPDERQVLIERSAQGLLDIEIGDKILVRTNQGKPRQLIVAGFVYDRYTMPSSFSGVTNGYVTQETMVWLGESDLFNRLLIIVSDDSYNVDHLKTISQRVIDRIEKNGWDVIWSWVDPNPGSHPDGQIVQAIVLVLGTMGILSLVMSGFLVTNTISALLQRHIRQIGIMKAIGARPQDIMGLYISIVLMYGLLSLLIAVPAGIGATRIATQFLAKLLNFDITSFDTPYYVWGLQILVGLVIPILASLYPILLGARITIREAMANYGVSGEDDKVNVFVRFLKKIQIFPRPVLLSIRNAFRQRGRLLLTLLPLIIGGVIFIAVFSVRASITKTSAEAARYYRYDILVEFDRSYRLEQLQREAMRVPGVAVVEGWGGMETRRVRADGSMGDDMMLLALPAMTSLIDPVLVSGKWLKPEDDNGIVVTSSFLKNEPDVGVGDEIVLRLRGRDTNWIVVGIVRSTERIAYVNYGYFVYANRDIGHVSRLQVVTTQSTLSSQLAVKDLLEARFKSMGLQINRVRTTDQLLLNIQEGFNIIILFLTIMAMLLAVVGGVGLMGAMWLSVLERTREIGVLRAMGASDTAIMQIFVIEGTIIGLLSWPVAVISAIPISRFLSDAVGTALLQVPLRYTFSAGSTLIWFVVILILSVLASFVPARNAAKLSIRETLTYE